MCMHSCVSTVMSAHAPAKRQRTSEQADLILKHDHPCPPYLSKQRAEESCHCDLIIRSSDGHELIAHRSVLAGSSEYFQRLFESGMTEASGVPIALDMPAPPLEAILAYIYEGACPIDYESVLPLLEAAVYLQIEPLEAVLAEHATRRLTPVTCLTMLQLARSRPYPKLEEAIWQRMPEIVMFGIGLMMRSEEYSSLPDADVARIIGLAEKHCDTFREIHLVEFPDGVSASRKKALAQSIFKPFAPTGTDLEYMWSVGGVWPEQTSEEVIVRFQVPLHAIVSNCDGRMSYSGRKTGVTEVRGWLATGFPKQLSLGDLSFEHYRFNIDRGITFDEALVTWAHASAHDPNEGFYRGRHPLKLHSQAAGGMYPMQLLILKGDGVYETYRPSTGLGGSTTISETKRSFTKVSPDEAKLGWQQHYHYFASNCVHGTKCARRREGKECFVGRRMLGYKDVLVGPILSLWHDVALSVPTFERVPIIRVKILGKPAGHEHHVQGLVVDRSKLRLLFPASTEDDAGAAGTSGVGPSADESADAAADAAQDATVAELAAYLNAQPQSWWRAGTLREVLDALSAHFGFDVRAAGLKPVVKELMREIINAD